jgi:hypothetical protein
MRGVSRLRLVALAAACFASIATASIAVASLATGSAAAVTAQRPAAVVWLCRPGLANDPCTAGLTATVISPDGKRTLERASPARAPGVDCFYVYPTISGESTINASLAVGFRQQEVAIAQASRFSQVCNVYAPVYPQITLAALEHPARITLADALTAYRGVLAAFEDYLEHYNRGRGIVFIGHSQGAVILIRLLKQQVDDTPLRRRLVSALLLGGNLTVPKGKRVGGDFSHIPACATRREAGCVVAYSSFTSKPAAGSDFGLSSSDAGVRLLAPHASTAGLRIMCVNPVSPGGGAALLDPYLPSLLLAFLPSGGLAVNTPWVAFPGEYTARCESSGDATWLQITRLPGRHPGPSLTSLQDAALGLHVLDVNIALGNLVALVASEANAYLKR